MNILASAVVASARFTSATCSAKTSIPGRNLSKGLRSRGRSGVDCVDLGGQDMKYDLAVQKHPGLGMIEDGHAFLANTLEGAESIFH